MFIDYDQLVEDYATLKVSKKDFYRTMGTVPAVYFKLTPKINAAEKLRQRIIADRKLEVVYFCGSSGSGKTTAAKYFAHKFHFDEFVSGSGEDFLDGYDKEECLILDDFRAGSMKFMELLKMLDNNTNSSVRSRYNNKDLSNCKLIIITSVIEPDSLYKKLQESGEKEPVEQLYRRLKHHFFKIDDDGIICEYSLTLQGSNRTGQTLGSIEDIYKELGIDPKKTNNASILDSFKKKETRTFSEEVKNTLLTDCIF